MPHELFFGFSRTFVWSISGLANVVQCVKSRSGSQFFAGQEAMAFSTPAANEAFKSALTVPATAVLSPPVESADSKDL